MSTWRERPDLIQLGWAGCGRPSLVAEEELDGGHDLGGSEKRRNVVPAVQSQESSIDPLAKARTAAKIGSCVPGDGHRRRFQPGRSPMMSRASPVMRPSDAGIMDHMAPDVLGNVRRMRQRAHVTGVGNLVVQGVGQGIGGEPRPRAMPAASAPAAESSVGAPILAIASRSSSAANMNCQSAATCR